MWKLEHIPAIGKQNNNPFHAYQKWEIKHGQIQEEMNSTIRFFDPQNIVLDTKIIILCALVQKLSPKTHFCEMMENITYP